MEVNEIINMYDHIALNGSGHGGPAARKRTVIADMMMYIDQWTSNGAKGFVIGREDGDRRWSIEFRVVRYERMPDASFKSLTTYGRPVQPFTLKSVISQNCLPEIMRWEGDYEAYRHDFTLLRMFSHEWFNE